MRALLLDRTSPMALVKDILKSAKLDKNYGSKGRGNPRNSDNFIGSGDRRSRRANSSDSQQEEKRVQFSYYVGLE